MTRSYSCGNSRRLSSEFGSILDITTVSSIDFVAVTCCKEPCSYILACPHMTSSTLTIKILKHEGSELSDFHGVPLLKALADFQIQRRGHELDSFLACFCGENSISASSSESINSVLFMVILSPALHRPSSQTYPADFLRLRWIDIAGFQNAVSARCGVDILDDGAAAAYLVHFLVRFGHREELNSPLGKATVWCLIKVLEISNYAVGRDGKGDLLRISKCSGADANDVAFRIEKGPPILPEFKRILSCRYSSSSVPLPASQPELS